MRVGLLQGVLQIELVIVTDNRVVRSRGGDLTWGGATFVAVLDKHFPLVCRVLELVQIESNQIIKEETLNLTSEHVKLRSQDVQCVSITSRGAGARRNGTGPLARC
jgi:hypothetical protein